LKEANIEGRHQWKAMHAQPVFSAAKYATAGEMRVSEILFERGVCLPSDTKMTMEDVDRVCDVIRGLF
jgi:dTDP-4-amino-4,6-dideoxygalactose transaminase